MDYREISYKSSNGDGDIYAYVWEPSEEVKTVGVLQISHDMCEHARRYTPFARYMTEKGFVVCANDHLGHGKSANGQFGFMGEKNGYKTLAKDVYKLFNIMKKDYNDIPYVLLGQSMGSFIARYVCSLWGIEFDGAIFCGTSGGGNMLLSAGSFSGMLGNMRGAAKEANWIYKMLEKHNNKYFKDSEHGKSWLSRDENEVQLFKNDPLCDFPFTYSGYRDLTKLLSIVSSKQWAERMPKDLPVYMFSGLDDPIGNFGRGVIKVYGELVNAGCENVEIKLYEDARHEMFFELNKAEVYNDVYAWIMESVFSTAALPNSTDSETEYIDDKTSEEMTEE